VFRERWHEGECDVRIKEGVWTPSFSSEYDGANWLEKVWGAKEDASGRLEGKMARFPKHMHCHAHLARKNKKKRSVI
jgi:hypothetical protein